MSGEPYDMQFEDGPDKRAAQIVLHHCDFLSEDRRAALVTDIAQAMREYAAHEQG